MNGGEHSWFAALPELKRAGCDIVAFAPGSGPLCEHLRAHSVQHVPWDVFVGEHRRSLASVREELSARLSELRPKVIHANSLSVGRMVGPVAAKLGIPSISHLRDIVRLSPQVVADLNQNQRLLAVSVAVKDWHTRQGIQSDKMSVLYNGIDCHQFAPRTATGYLHREFGLAERTIVLGSVGQIGLRKGTDILLEAFARVAVEFTDLALVIVGERNSQKSEAVEFEQALRARAQRADLRGRVYFVGRRNDIARCMNEWSILIHAARQEPLGRVLLEGAASGLPIIATDVGGTREIFPPVARAAVVIPPNDDKELAAAMLRLLGSSEEREALSRAARRRIEADFTDVRSGQGLAQCLIDVGCMH